MSENNSNEEAAADNASAAAPAGFDLEDCLAVGPPVQLPIVANDYSPVPVCFEGHSYSIRRAFTGKRVSAFMKALRHPRLVPSGATDDDGNPVLDPFDVGALVLGEVLVDGDAAQLGSDIEDRSPIEADILYAAIYKISGLMGATSGKFLAS